MKWQVEAREVVPMHTHLGQSAALWPPLRTLSVVHQTALRCDEE